MVISEKVEVKHNDKIGGIYKITNKINNKFYVGSTNYFYGRWKSHINDLNGNRHTNRYLQNSFNKYGKDNFEFSILEIIDDENNLIIREQYWMDLLNSNNSKIGYNILPFAGRTSGVKRTEETKRKLSEAKIGNKNPMFNKEVSEETRKRLSEALINMPEDKKKEMLKKRGKKISEIQKGRKFNDKTKQKMRERKLGGKLTDEHKKNIKESSNSIRIVQIDLKGNLTSEWNSMIDAQRELNYDCGAISKCCNKINKTYKGYLWFFASEYYSKEFNIDIFINRPKRENSIKCAVLQIDPHSKNVIKKWDNIDDAVKVLNLNKSTLLCCCRGKYKTHKNFIWKFVD